MLTQSDRRADTDAMFDEFVRDALEILLVATLGLVWVWTCFVALFDAEHARLAYLALGFAAGIGLACYHFADHQLRTMVVLYLVSLTVIISIIVLAYHNAETLFLFMQVILVAAALTTQRTLWLTTGLVVATTIVVGAYSGMAAAALLLPIFLQLITALAAWLSTRRLFTALEWALNMADRAQRNAEAARTHRFELQRVMQSLDIALSRLERSNRALVFAQEAAEKAYRFKADFVANVSHELRTPLNLIVGFSEMMATAPESYGGLPLPREYRGDMLAIYRSSHHLLDLINDVLDLSQIESGRMAIHKERVRLADVITEAAEIVRGLAEARKLNLVVDLPDAALVVNLDRIRIRQVLLNLLTNAMRYTDSGSVCVRTHAEEGEVTVTVEDSGRGIAPEKLTRAFEVFDRLDEEELSKGSGLGLAVSKRFVDLHDGHMWIASAVGQGTTVSFALPLPAERERMPLATLRLSHSPDPEDRPPLVLVFHNDRRVLALLRRRVGGCEFVLAEDGDQARHLLQHAFPHAVLVDADSVERWDAATQGMASAAQIPTLLCPLPSVHLVGAQLGAADFLPKPVMREDLALVLQRLPHQPQTALVIDDDPHIVRLMGRMLRVIAPDVRVLEAFGGEEGLALARSHSPDVIFVDLKMPGMSGQQFIQIATSEASLATIPIIVVSVRSIADEAAPLLGEVRLRRTVGFSLSEMLTVVEALLAHITRADAISPANAASLLADSSGLPA